jgi:hypothetical protein
MTSGQPRVLQPLGELSEEQSVVWDVLSDRRRRGDPPGTDEDLARATEWPGERPYDITRVRRILRELQTLGYVRRVSSSSRGVYWLTRRAER